MTARSKAGSFARLAALVVLFTGCSGRGGSNRDDGAATPPDRGDAGICTSCNGPSEPRCALERAGSGSCFAPLATYDGTTDLTISVAWSPIDDYVLTGADGELRLLELTGEPAFREAGVFREQGGRIDVAWSPDGQFALSASTDVRLLAIDRQNGVINEIAPTFTGHFGDVYAIAWSPDGAYAMSVGQDGAARLLSVDAPNGHLDEVAAFYVSGKIYDVAFSPDGSLAAIANQDGTARVLSVDRERRVLREVSSVIEDGWVTAVAWSPRGDQLLTGTWLPCDTLEQFSMSPQGNAITAVSLFRGHPSGLRVLRFHPERDLVLSAGHDDTVRLFRFVGFNRQLVHIATWDDNQVGVHAVSFSPDGRRLLVAASHVDRLTLLDMTPCFPE